MPTTDLTQLRSAKLKPIWDGPSIPYQPIWEGIGEIASGAQSEWRYSAKRDIISLAGGNALTYENTIKGVLDTTLKNVGTDFDVEHINIEGHRINFDQDADGGYGEEPIPDAELDFGITNHLKKSLDKWVRTRVLNNSTSIVPLNATLSQIADDIDRIVSDVRTASQSAEATMSVFMPTGLIAKFRRSKSYNVSALTSLTEDLRTMRAEIVEDLLAPTTAVYQVCFVVNEFLDYYPGVAPWKSDGDVDRRTATKWSQYSFSAPDYKKRGEAVMKPLVLQNRVYTISAG